MRIKLPHTHDPAEIRRRLDERSHEIVEYFPEGMASLERKWRNDTRMDFTIGIVGQRIGGRVEIQEDHVVVSLDLPLMLSFLRGKIERSLREEGTRLLR